MAIWEAGLFASGAGLTFVLCAFAWQWGVGGLGPSSLALGVAGGLADWLVVQAPTTASWPPAQAPIPAGPLPPGSHPADAATPALSSLSPSAPAAPSATKTGLSKADNELTASAGADQLPRYQRLTLALALLGTVLAALISVAGSLLTSSLTS